MKKLIILMIPIMVSCSKGNEPIVSNETQLKDTEVIMASKKKDTIDVIVYYANSTYNNIGQYPVPGAPVNAKEYDDKLFLITGQPWPAWWMVIKKWKRSDYPTDIYQPWPPKK